jgi:hypothetical protein
MANAADDRISIDVQAEKSAFSEKLTLQAPHRDMVKPTESIKVEPHKLDFIKHDNTNPAKFESNFMGIQGDTTKLDSPIMKFDSSVSHPPSLTQGSVVSMQENLKGTDSIKSNPLSSELLNTSLKQSSQDLTTASVNKQIDKALQTKITPALQNLAQYTQQMSNTNTDHKNVHDELPTMPPSNLVFNDRLESAMQVPNWA